MPIRHVSTLCWGILTGWNFAIVDIKQRSLQLLALLDVMFVMLSPPCTAFSVLQRLWNNKRRDPAIVQQEQEEGAGYVNHSMDAASEQLRRGRFFCFEHPSSSSAWALPAVRQIRENPEVFTVTFDQCMVGLQSPLYGKPMRKRTRLMTNSWAIVNNFRGLMCDKNHGEHQRIQGAEAGVRLSVHAQLYPRGMVERLAAAAQAMER